MDDIQALRLKIIYAKKMIFLVEFQNSLLRQIKILIQHLVASNEYNVL